MGNRFRIILCLTASAMLAGGAMAESRKYCVSCKDPDQTYVCQVDTPYASPGGKGLQLYCIIRTSKDGGHASCTIAGTDAEQCAGPVRIYTFEAPVIPPRVRDAVQRLRKAGDTDSPEESLLTVPPQKGGEPKTLIDMTGRAVTASRKGIKNTGKAVTGAASATTGTVGKVVRGAGKGVTKTARKVGSVTKKTGSAAASAAKTAYDCLRSLFKNCGASQ